MCKLYFKSFYLGEKLENVMALTDLANKTFKEPFCNSNSLRNFENLHFGNVLSVKRQLYLLCWRSKSNHKNSKKTPAPNTKQGNKTKPGFVHWFKQLKGLLKINNPNLPVLCWSLFQYHYSTFVLVQGCLLQPAQREGGRLLQTMALQPHLMCFAAHELRLPAPGLKAPAEGKARCSWDHGAPEKPPPRGVTQNARAAPAHTRVFCVTV